MTIADDNIPFFDREDDTPETLSPKRGRPKKEKPADVDPFADNEPTSVDDEGRPTLDAIDEQILFGTTPSTQADIAKIREDRERREQMIEKGHSPGVTRGNNPPPPQTLIAPVPRNDNPTSPNISADMLLQIQRAEELEAELVRTNGRFIPGSDDARPGVPYKPTPVYNQEQYMNRNVSDTPQLEGVKIVLPLINDLNINALGVPTAEANNPKKRILDTGEGAQAAPIMNPELMDHQVYDGPNKTIASSNPNDPRSEAFLTCANSMCPHREGCLRYRLKNRRTHSFPFFPESCRKEGIYMPVEGNRFTGYDPFDTLERGSGNITSLPSPG